jgi:cephalosporin hydroxylase
MNLRKITRTVRRPLNRYFAFRRMKQYHSQSRTLEDAVSWALNFGSSGYYRVKTSQIRSEIVSLAKTVAALKPKIILEIGTARGGTLLIWSRIASKRVISCDIEDLSIQRELFKAFPPPGSSCQVTLLTGDSHDAGFKQRVREQLQGEKADFLFIDGDHTEAGVTADYNDYKEFVSSGGIIAFHDIVEKQSFETNQVFHLWKQLKLEAETEEFIDNPDQCGFGIGILRIP